MHKWENNTNMDVKKNVGVCELNSSDSGERHVTGYPVKTVIIINIWLPLNAQKLLTSSAIIIFPKSVLLHSVS